MSAEGFKITTEGHTITKDPNEKLDYNLDWGNRLAAFGGEIATSEWTVPAGLTTAVAGSFVGGVTTIYLSGGTEGKTYTVRNKITTTAAPDARIMSKSFKIVVKNK